MTEPLEFVDQSETLWQLVAEAHGRPADEMASLSARAPRVISPSELQEVVSRGGDAALRLYLLEALARLGDRLLDRFPSVAEILAEPSRFPSADSDCFSPAALWIEMRRAAAAQGPYDDAARCLSRYLWMDLGAELRVVKGFVVLKTGFWKLECDVFRSITLQGKEAFCQTLDALVQVAEWADLWTPVWSRELARVQIEIGRHRFPEKPRWSIGSQIRLDVLTKLTWRLSVSPTMAERLQEFLAVHVEPRPAGASAA